MSTFPPSGKAFPRFEAAEIDFMLENHELPDKLVEWFELALEAAKTSDEDEIAVGFFIKHAEDEQFEVEEDDLDARREQQRDDKRDFADEPNED